MRSLTQIIAPLKVRARGSPRRMGCIKMGMRLDAVHGSRGPGVSLMLTLQQSACRCLRAPDPGPPHRDRHSGSEHQTTHAE